MNLPRTVRAVVALIGLVACTLVVAPSPAMAQLNGFRNGAVGGVSINVSGVVEPLGRQALKENAEALRKAVSRPAEELVAPRDLRVVSLRGIERACTAALQADGARPIPDEIRFLAGLQRIKYVFVDPERHDVLLVGPGEGWRVDDQANVVGATSGRPVLRLDDLLIALRSVEQARMGGISCSINPTEEGMRNLQSVLNQAGRTRNVAPVVLENRMKQAFGPQTVSIQGIDPSTHFANVLVAADYRMKRLAMRLDPAPIEGLPSYLDLMRNQRKATNINPRWWLACNYEPLGRSDDGLSWELRGPGVKVMTEDDMVTADGQTVATGQKSPAAQRWADLMTSKYDELAAKDVVFDELRNLMDLCVVAALLQHERLLERADVQLPLLNGADRQLPAEAWQAPTSLAPQISFLRTSGALLVTASGGVQINSWEVASRSEVRNGLEEVRSQAGRPANDDAWWN